MSCKPPLVPKATYTLLGFTAMIYLLQMASMAICKLAWGPVLITGGRWADCSTAQYLPGSPSALGSGGNLPSFHLQDQREFREIVLGASEALLVFGALATWGLFSG